VRLPDDAVTVTVVPPLALRVTRKGPELWDVPAAMVTGAPVTVNLLLEPVGVDATATVKLLVALTAVPDAF
jgi:hypothetical protein